MYGWDILELSEYEYKDWTRHDKIENIKGWLKEAQQRQVEKGNKLAVWK